MPSPPPSAGLRARKQDGKKDGKPHLKVEAVPINDLDVIKTQITGKFPRDDWKQASEKFKGEVREDSRKAVKARLPSKRKPGDPPDSDLPSPGKKRCMDEAARQESEESASSSATEVETPMESVSEGGSSGEEADVEIVGSGGTCNAEDDHEDNGDTRQSDK